MLGGRLLLLLFRVGVGVEAKVEVEVEVEAAVVVEVPSSSRHNNDSSPWIPATAMSTQSRRRGGSASMKGRRSAADWFSSRFLKRNRAPLIHICVATMTIPRQKVMNSAMPSSRTTDWKVSAKQVATVGDDLVS